MAILYIDGFDHYSTATTDQLSDIAPSLWIHEFDSSHNGKPVMMEELGTLGLRSLWYQAGSFNSASNKLQLPSTPASGESWKFGAHFYITSFNNLRTSAGIFGIGGASGVPSFSLSWDASARLLRFSNTANGTVYVTSDFAVSAEVLYHVELEIYFHASEGSAECRINGQPIMTLSNHDTMFASRSHLLFTPQQMSAGGGFHSNGMIFDNLFITRDHDWLGERNVSTLVPNADEIPQDWTLSTGSDAFELLNDVPPNDATFISTADANDVARFGLTNLPNPDVVVSAVQVNVRGNKTGTDDAGVTPSVHVGAATAVGNEAFMTQDQFENYFSVFEVSPDTAEAFTPAEIDALEVSVERTT